MPPAERTLAIVSSSSARDVRGGGGAASEFGRSSRRSTTLPAAPERSRRRSRSATGSRPAGGSALGGQSSAVGSSRYHGTVSKVTRSRSMTSRPAGVAIHHPPNSLHYTTGSRGERIPVSPVEAVATEYAVQQSIRRGSGSRPGTRMSVSGKSGRSHATSRGNKNTTKAGVVVETMSAPNPFCPNTRGVCCLMVLINIALALVCIGFIIVLQLYDPPFVW